MQKIKLICIGNVKEKYFLDAINEYTKRLSRFCDFSVVEIKECLLKGGVGEQQVINKESDEILEKMEGAFNCLFDLRGKEITSVELAEVIKKRANFSDSKINFIIGGSLGVNEEVVKKSDLIIRVGKLTFPHQLMRVLAVEQIYRAETIINNVKYHK